MKIAVIPARGGSKRIPRKNIKPFCGKPMIAYAITAAIDSGLFDHVIVSTDDDEIANIAVKYGAEIPFQRPDELSNDYVATVPVIQHTVNHCLNLLWSIDYVCCIYPGVPFIQVSDLKNSFDLLISNKADYCFPISEYPSAIQRALKKSNEGTMYPFYPEFEFTRTQDLEPSFFDPGQFYWGTTNAWLTNPRIHSSGIGFEIPYWRVVDIDTPTDWTRAENMASTLYKIK
jgi:pseudaminic acid cytidylyltransferase